MFQKVITKVFGSKEDRDVKKFRDIVEAVNQREADVKKLTDAQLQSRTPEFRRKLDAGASLDELLPDAFAAVREAAVRTLKQRHYDVQIMGGVALHQGCIAEMRTGEGKTLTSTLAVYLNALTGKGVHLATVNDYLARRDAEWMGKIYNFLGLSVGLTLNLIPYEQKKLGYKADVTYGVHSEFGFNYLHDNSALSLDAKVQRGHAYAILDEVDSILIDEARTPLIISIAAGKPAELYRQVNSVVTHLKEGEHFQIDQQGKSRGSVTLTDEGVEEVERRLGVGNLYDHTNIAMVHHVNQALTANHLYKRDVDYLVENGEVLLVDEFTGRKQIGRRLSEGLHQAIEAKERVKVVQENETSAKITYQNYFRMYDKLAGMTGTAATEANEFAHIYGLEVAVIPTNEPMIRMDNPDQIYATEDAKYEAVLGDIVEEHEKGRPILVGTASIESSEKLSKMLRTKHRDIKHQVLNAKEHAHEADIVAQAGIPGAVTIATNMAGRGVDILLGGNPEGLAKEMLRKQKKKEPEPHPESEEFQAALEKAEAICDENKEKVLAAGGLHIVGTERHESRRIDNQLRGRAGRQGDPGSSRFYLSLEDELMRKFGSERLQGLMTRVGMDEEVPLEHPWVTKSIEKAQTRVEQIHFEMRKNLLKFDDVMDSQRDTIYTLRDTVLASATDMSVLSEDEDIPETDAPASTENGRVPEEIGLAALAEKEGKAPATLKTTICQMIERVVQDAVDDNLSERGGDTLENPDRYEQWLTSKFPVKPIWNPPLAQANLDEVEEQTLAALRELYEQREAEFGPEMMRLLERLLLLDRIDDHWKDHLQNIDYIEEGIRFGAGYGGKDPIVVFKNEALAVFESMYQQIEEEVSEFIFKSQVNTQAPRRAPGRRTGKPRRQPPRRAQANRATSASDAAAFASQQAMGNMPKVGRNAPCPCGSGKKYKRCHGG
ncbi:preprotein translocase subunit SecA [Candidatus Poribacteria bacterium]|nr:preprotein translocase subunit SecA [Candidatus Poribacteria bacterium]MYH81405.1 preprotein translocase subunit SecA [Candidatus Poribacteria bacterium]MYK95362.1 preprotein translocase subunit SecA [Candidatus Poribacteria bacterium]